MGYCVEIEKSTISFKKENINDLMDKVKNDFREGRIEGRWIDKYEVIESESVEEFFDALRLVIYEGNYLYKDTYKIEYMSGEKLDGCELELYNSMAEFVDDGYIEYLGEDGERWRYVFKNGKCREVYPKVIWE